MEISIDTNIDEVIGKLDNVPPKIMTGIGRALVKASLVIERGSKERAPVDTGRMRASILTTIHPLRATIRTNTFYAIFVHEGTRFVKGRPFMRDTAEAEGSRIEGIFKEEINRAIDA